MAWKAPGVRQGSITDDQRFGVRARTSAPSGGTGASSSVGGPGTASVRVVLTTNQTLSGALTYGGVALASGDLVLPVAQTDAAENVIYQVNTAGDWLLDTSRRYVTGMAVHVEEGTLARSTWKVATTGPITAGSTEVQWGLDVGTVPDEHITTSLIADSAVTNAKIAAASKPGLLADLITTVKTSLVAAINELATAINVIASSLVTTWLGLSDTPDSYSGQAGKAVRVNAGATALEFFTLPSGVTLTGTNGYYAYKSADGTLLTGRIQHNANNGEVEILWQSGDDDPTLFVGGASATAIAARFQSGTNAALDLLSAGSTTTLNVLNNDVGTAATFTAVAGPSIATTSRVKIKTRALTASATLLGTDHLIRITGFTAGNITLTLPSASDYTDCEMIFKDETGQAGSVNKTVTIQRAGSSTIDGQNSIALTAYSYLRIYSNGSNWFIIT